MDLIDKLKELSNRIQRQRESVLTEQAAKTAFVLPFLQALGYDVFNPSEVIPVILRAAIAQRSTLPEPKMSEGIK